MKTATPRIIETLFIAHQVPAVSFTIPLQANGATRRVRGSQVAIVRLDVPTVALLTEESTPQKPVVAPDAEERFRAAAEALLADGTQVFYTVLHPDWNGPAFLWQPDLTTADHTYRK